MTGFNEEEMILLEKIVADKFSIGAFSGMIYNASLTHKDITVEELIKRALAVRIKMQKLVE